MRCCSRVSRAATHARGVLHCVEVGAGVALARKNMCVQSHSRGKLVWSAQHNTLLNLRGQPRCQLHTLQRRHTRAMLQPYVPCGNACSWRAPLLGGWCRGRIDTTKYAILCVQSHARGKRVLCAQHNTIFAHKYKISVVYIAKQAPTLSKASSYCSLVHVTVDNLIELRCFRSTLSAAFHKVLTRRVAVATLSLDVVVGR